MIYLQLALLPLSIYLTFYSLKNIKKNDFLIFLFIGSIVTNIVYPIYLYKHMTGGYDNVNYNTNVFNPIGLTDLFIEKNNSK